MGAGLFKNVAVKGLAVEYCSSTWMFSFTLVTSPKGKYPQNPLDRRLVAGTDWVWIWWRREKSYHLKSVHPHCVFNNQKYDLVIPDVLCLDGTLYIMFLINFLLWKIKPSHPGSWLSCHFTLPFKMFLISKSFLSCEVSSWNYLKFFFFLCLLLIEEKIKIHMGSSYGNIDRTTWIIQVARKGYYVTSLE